jgi:phospholipase C
VEFSSDGRRVAAGGANGKAEVWDASNGKELRSVTDQNRYRSGGPLQLVSGGEVAWSPDGRRLATVNENGTVTVWDAQTWQVLITLTGHDSKLWSVRWSPVGQRLATGNMDGTASVWDAGSGKELLTLNGHSNYVFSVAWSPDGRWLATGSADKTTIIWDTNSGAARLRFVHPSSVMGVAWNPDGHRLATADGDNTARIWDVNSSKEVRTLNGHTAGLMSVAWSPNGRWLATASRDKTVKLWDAETGKEILTLNGHTDTVTSVAWNPDGQRLASASLDGTSRIWRALIDSAPQFQDIPTSVAITGNPISAPSVDKPAGQSPPAIATSQNHPPIKHLIVVMLENRSFDHMLGALKAKNPNIDGLTGSETNPDPNGQQVKVQPLAAFQGQLNPDPASHFPAVDLQIFGGNTQPDRPANMQGFVKSYSNQKSGTHSRVIMYYFSPDKLPILTTLATEFAVCDRWFSSVPGPSLPNRAFAHYGTSFGRLDLSPTYHAQNSIYERMLENDHTAKVYYNDAASSTMDLAYLLQNHPELFGTFQQFNEDARSGTLPEYSFVEPNFNDHDSGTGLEVATDQHPDHNVQAGEHFIAQVYNAIRNNEDLWLSSVLVITYSNHGGIYDHVPPPSAPHDQFASADPPFAFDRLGVRVPAVIVSPYIAKGTVDHTVYDHASIPATVSKIFALSQQKVATRERYANTFESVLTLTTPRSDSDVPNFELNSSAK